MNEVYLCLSGLRRSWACEGGMVRRPSTFCRNQSHCVQPRGPNEASASEYKTASCAQPRGPNESSPKATAPCATIESWTVGAALFGKKLRLRRPPPGSELVIGRGRSAVCTQSRGACAHCGCKSVLHHT